MAESMLLHKDVCGADHPVGTFCNLQPMSGSVRELQARLDHLAWHVERGDTNTVVRTDLTCSHCGVLEWAQRG